MAEYKSPPLKDDMALDKALLEGNREEAEKAYSKVKPYLDEGHQKAVETHIKTLKKKV